MHAPIDNLKMTWAFDGSNGSITQYFGNKAGIYTSMNLDGHNGIDIVAKWKSPLYAVCKGIVMEVNRDATGYGRHIRLLDTEKTPDGFQENWVYGHCEDIFVEAGDEVEAGQVIGTMGNTGFVTSVTPDGKHPGTHLHLGVRKELYKDGVRVSVKDYENGYYGRYDFRDRLENAKTVVPVKTLMLSVVSLAEKAVSLLKTLVK